MQFLDRKGTGDQLKDNVRKSAKRLAGFGGLFRFLYCTEESGTALQVLVHDLLHAGENLIEREVGGVDDYRVRRGG